MMINGRLRFLLLLSCFALAPHMAQAHSMYQSAVLLDFDGNHVNTELQLPIDRLSISFRQTVDRDHFLAEKDQLRQYVLEHVHPVMLDGQPMQVTYRDMSIQNVEQVPYLVVHMVFTPPKQESVDHFVLNYDVIAHEIVTHVVLISIRSDVQHPIPTNDPVLLGMIRWTKKSQNVDRFKR